MVPSRGQKGAAISSLFFSLFSTPTQNSPITFVNSFTATTNINQALSLTKSQFKSSSNPFSTPALLFLSNNSNNNNDNDTTSSTKTAKKNDKQRAGAGGYSILRQPVSYDSTSDPTFEVPMSLDETEEDHRKNNINALWFEERKSKTKPQKDNFSSDSTTKPSTSSSSTSSSLYKKKKSSNTEKDAAEQQSLDLNRRTMDTLDYPIILTALAKECETVPARTLVLKSASHDKEDEEEEEARLKKRKKSKQKSSSSSSSSTSTGDADDDVMTMPLTATSVTGVQRRYKALQEMKRLVSTNVYGYVPQQQQQQQQQQKSTSSSSPKQNTKKNRGNKRVQINLPPIMGTSFDLQPIFDLVDEGRVLEGPEILDIATTLEILLEVVDWSNTLQSVGKKEENDEQEIFTELPKLCKSIYVDADLTHLLTNAFDAEGRLSAKTFPAIGKLRSQVRSYKQQIMTKLDAIISSPSMKNKLALESGGPIYSEVNGGRIVIPVQDKYKNSGVGIMHDVSRSGKTAFVEPTEIVGVTNEMKQLEVELKQEEAKVWRRLTEEVIKHREDIERSIGAIVQLDLVLARMRLGDKLNGVVPVVKDEGVMSVKDALHPVLVLRELEDIVGNDIDLGDDGNQGLVLTGPNSGGKTVILKLMGLFALMTRDGIPVPAAVGDGDDEAGRPRVDYFEPVLADIGDIQSVDGDLSTFSGHMLVCREVLSNARRNALVLMDELGSGTDPAQGVAIAQALLEALLESGSRVAITTHYMELKQLAASDDRFAVGGMQFVGGRPTYKLLPGTVGESYALAVAERLNLPSSVIKRANELLDSETRQMGDLIRDLEDQKAVMDRQAEELAQKRKDMAKLELEMQTQREKLEAKQLSARRDEARKFAKKLEEKERILEDILGRLKSDPSKKLLARSWDDIRFVRRDALTEAENVPSVLKMRKQAAAAAARVELVPLSEMREKPDLKVGDTLVICKKGAFRGKEGVINELGSKIQLSVGGMPVQMKMSELSLPPSSMSAVNGDGGNSKKNANTGPKMSKLARKAMAESESMQETVINDNSSFGTGNKKEETDLGRLESNTIDVRGCNLEEARRKCETAFSQVMTAKRPVVYILHGHGASGVLKQKIRDWLNRDREWVKKWTPANREDGGDAFTRVEVKKIKF